MVSTPPLYTPYRTGERTAVVCDDVSYRHRVALFEPLRVDRYETRAQALAQIESNLVSWTQIAYRDSLKSGRRSGALEASAAKVVPRLQRCRDSNDGVFPLDADYEWSSDDEAKAVNASTSSLLTGVPPQAPPYPSSSTAFCTGPSDGEYSMYGIDSTIFDRTKPANELKEILKSYLLTVLRASVDCPFADVRRHCRYILHRVHKLGAIVPDLICDGPSWLISAAETIAFCHDAASERPVVASTDESGSLELKKLGSAKDSWGSSSFLSDISDEEISGSPMKRGRSATIIVSGSPLKRDASSSNADAQDVNEIFFESDDEGAQETEEFAHSTSPSRSPSPKLTSSAIPIRNRRNNRPSIAPGDIDDILLGPASSHGTRKARFSLQPPSLDPNNRPALGRKRTSSFATTLHQRRASRTLRSFHLTCYQTTGRVTNLGRILSYFPRFYESTIILHDELIRKQGGPLQRAIKLYLAILAAAQANCQYLVSYFSKKYVQLGQHTEWLNGLSDSSRKIQRLGRINSLLAHQPWRIQKSHIEELLSRSKESADKGDVSDQWTMSELVQSLCILIVENCQAHFCLAVGTVAEPDTFGGACIRKQRQEVVIRNNSISLDVFPLFTSYDSKTFASRSSYDAESSKSKPQMVEQSPCMILPSNTNTSTAESGTPAESAEESVPNLLWKRRNSIAQPKLWVPRADTDDNDSIDEEFRSTGVFARCGNVDLDMDTAAMAKASSKPPHWAAANLVCNAPGTNGLISPLPSYHDVAQLNQETTQTMPVNPILEDMSRFSDPTDQVGPEDFNLNSSEIPVHRLSDYNWEDHTCSLIGRFVPGLETVLDHNLQEARDAAGDEDDGFFFISENGTAVNQGPLREAVWFFILRLYGIYNDGYDYSDVDALLNKSVKRFLRKVCFLPGQITRQDWEWVGRGLKSQEKVLLALLATHAKMYTCLVYAFRYCE